MGESKEKPCKPDRRGFLKVAATSTFGLIARGVLARSPQGSPSLPSNTATAGTMARRSLGRTGYRVGVFSLGGQAALEQPNNEQNAVALVERALDLGVNYIDTAPRYGGSERWSERYIGQVMKRRRAQVFLASKTHDRTRDGSLRLLEQSLRRLQTDHLDLWQIHNLERMEEVDQIFSPNGAVQALIQGREQKMVRFLGVTGHADPYVLAEAIRRFPFDTILMALNAADKHHLSFIDHLLPLAVEKQMGIIGMKVPARGYLLFSWGKLLRLSRPGTLTMRQALNYVLSLPVSTVIIGCDSVAQLEENLQIARSFVPLSEQEMKDLEARAGLVARQALFFRNWS